jgi:hypothetical protein
MVLYDPHHISEKIYFYLFTKYSQIPNIHGRVEEKYTLLKLLGVNEKHIEKMCRPKELDREAILKEVAREILRDRRRLRKWDRERRLEEERMQITDVSSNAAQL